MPLLPFQIAGAHAPHVLCGTESQGSADVAGAEAAPTNAGDSTLPTRLFGEGLGIFLEPKN